MYSNSTTSASASSALNTVPYKIDLSILEGIAGTYEPITGIYEPITAPPKEPEITCRIPEVERIIYNNPATIVFWNDDTKTVVKAMSTTEFNPYHGFCAAVAKKMFGGNCTIKRIIRDKGGIDVNADPNIIEGEFVE